MTKDQAGSLLWIVACLTLVMTSGVGVLGVISLRLGDIRRELIRLRTERRGGP